MKNSEYLKIYKEESKKEPDSYHCIYSANTKHLLHGRHQVLEAQWQAGPCFWLTYNLAKKHRGKCHL